MTAGKIGYAIGLAASAIVGAVGGVSAIRKAPETRIEEKLDALNEKVSNKFDELNTRLSRLEGVLTGATRQ